MEISLQVYDQVLLALTLALALQLFGMLLAVCMDSYLPRRNRRLLLVSIFCSALLVFQNQLDFWLERQPNATVYRTFCADFGYSIRPLLIVLFILIINEGGRQWVYWALLGFNAVVYMTSYFTHLANWFDEDNILMGGPLHNLCAVLSFALLAWLVISALLHYRRVQNREAVMPIVLGFVIIASTVMDLRLDYNTPIAFLTVSIVVSIMLMYLWLHLQFVREHEDALHAEQRMRIMVSQIQPHFLFNTLTTIQALCRKDPEKAFETTEKFGVYLRQNIDSLSQSQLIPFERELEHTRIYTDIEQIRFPSIRIHYDIRDAEFELPALTLQPMVENAIRHGIRGVKDGAITIRTQEIEGFHEIVIRDNGKGFDTSRKYKPGEVHIGVANVRERIETVCHGTFEIYSRINEGTTVFIRIPVGAGAPDNVDDLL